MQLSNIVIPDTRYVKEALAELEHAATPALIAHSWRTYYWAAALGLINQTRFDDELLLIGCLLHDLGFTAAHAKAGCGCFTLASAEAAKTWSHKVDYPAAKADQLADMICLHMNGHLEAHQQPESLLLQQGAACDVIGSRFYQFSPNYRAQVLQRYPRLDFNQLITTLIAQEARQHPQSRTALLRQLGLPLMIRLNPFDE